MFYSIMNTFFMSHICLNIQWDAMMYLVLWELTNARPGLLSRRPQQSATGQGVFDWNRNINLHNRSLPLCLVLICK